MEKPSELGPILPVSKVLLQRVMSTMDEGGVGSWCELCVCNSGDTVFNY
jgi:hypothetical protein